MNTRTSKASVPRRTRAFWINILILACSVLLALGLMEALARHFMANSADWPPFYVGEYENRPSPNFVVDDYTGWRMRPNHKFMWRIGAAREANYYISNSEGFRSDKEFSQKDPVVLVGDSFTFGTGVAYENTFGAVLERQRERTPVYNLAMPGFGIDQMAQAVHYQALPLKPQAIVVAFIDEDFDRSLTAFRMAEGLNKPTFVVDQLDLRQRTAADRPPESLVYVRRNFALASMLSQNLRQLARHLPFGDWWELNADLLQHMASDGGAAGVPILFVRMPQTGQREFTTLSKFMKSMDYHFLDLDEATSDIAEDEIFIAGDGHINAQGHRLVAEAIAEWLRKRQAGDL